MDLSILYQHSDMDMSYPETTDQPCSSKVDTGGNLDPEEVGIQQVSTCMKVILLASQKIENSNIHDSSQSRRYLYYQTSHSHYQFYM